MLLFSSIPMSESILWDLLITVSLEKNPLQVYEKPVVIGTIVDHAGKPVSGAEVKIRLDQESVVTLTNSTGNFIYEFEAISNPGRYIVNVMATSDDRIGLARTDFQIKGQISLSAQSAYNLELIDSTKYENINPDDLVNDPIGLTLYNYYLELQAKFLEDEAKQKELENYQKYLQEQRNIADELRQKIIEEENPSAGTFSGWKYDQFVSNLDLTIKDIIVNQLNYTINVFAEAQNAMEEVLKNGGTLEEARQAYYEKASIPRELMDSLTTFNMTDDTLTTTESNYTLPKNEEYLGIDYNSTNIDDEKTYDNVGIAENGTTVQLDGEVTTIFLNINGTIVELVINGTEISQVTNSQS